MRRGRGVSGGASSPRMRTAFLVGSSLVALAAMAAFASAHSGGGRSTRGLRAGMKKNEEANSAGVASRGDEEDLTACYPRESTPYTHKLDIYAYNDKARLRAEREAMQQQLMDMDHHLKYGRKVDAYSGLGLEGYMDGPSSLAMFNYPNDVSFDSQGNLFVADTHNGCIRMIDRCGNVTTFAGGHKSSGYRDGPGSSALFDKPIGLHVAETNGMIYVCDAGNNVVRTINATTRVVGTLAGKQEDKAAWRDGLRDSARFDGPASLSVSRHGDVFVADWNNNRIRKIDPNGYVTTIAGCGAQENGRERDGPGMFSIFRQPSSLAIDSQDMLYVGSMGSGLIRRVTPRGQVTTWAGKRFQSYDDDGNAVHDVERIFKAQKGIPRYAWKAVGLNESYTLHDPYMTAILGLAVDGDDRLYASDGATRCVYRVARGVTTTPEPIAGDRRHALTAQDGPARIAQFEQPSGIAISPVDHHLYVADRRRDRIRKIYCGPANLDREGEEYNPNHNIYIEEDLTHPDYTTRAIYRMDPKLPFAEPPYSPTEIEHEVEAWKLRKNIIRQFKRNKRINKRKMGPTSRKYLQKMDDEFPEEVGPSHDELLGLYEPGTEGYAPSPPDLPPPLPDLEALAIPKDLSGNPLPN